MDSFLNIHEHTAVTIPTLIIFYHFLFYENITYSYEGTSKSLGKMCIIFFSMNFLKCFCICTEIIDVFLHESQHVSEAKILILIYLSMKMM